MENRYREGEERRGEGINMEGGKEEKEGGYILERRGDEIKRQKDDG